MLADVFESSDGFRSASWNDQEEIYWLRRRNSVGERYARYCWARVGRTDRHLSLTVTTFDLYLAAAGTVTTTDKAV